MLKILCEECEGIGGYERPCQCFAEDNCPKCHGKGYWWEICTKCKGAGIKTIKENEFMEGWGPT